jgi:hypothetical protein
MSRKGNALGNRLGLSKDWISQFGFTQQGENVKNFIFIRQLIINFLEKFHIWFLDLRVVQKKNIINVYVLINYLNHKKKPLIKNAYLLTHVDKNWYWDPTIVGYLQVPRPPKSEWRVAQHRKSKKFLKKILYLLQIKYLYYRIIFLKAITIYLELMLTDYLKYPIKIYLYNLIDYYNYFEPNVISQYVSILLNMYEKDQKRLLGIKTSVFYLCIGLLRSNSYLIGKIFAREIRKHRRVGQLFTYFFKLIREFFHIIPLYNENNQKQRAEYLKIQISGKIDGKMRAVKKIYSFNRYKGKEIPIQTLNLKVDYSLTQSYTFAGVLGIKVWIY